MRMRGSHRVAACERPARRDACMRGAPVNSRRRDLGLFGATVPTGRSTRQTPTRRRGRAATVKISPMQTRRAKARASAAVACSRSGAAVRGARPKASQTACTARSGARGEPGRYGARRCTLVVAGGAAPAAGRAEGSLRAANQADRACAADANKWRGWPVRGAKGARGIVRREVS